jgi:hypothetical protein
MTPRSHIVPLSEPLEDSGGFAVTGVMAAGKSTVEDLLAPRFARGVHLRGDVFRKMIVTGRDPISPSFGSEAIRQAHLRQRLDANGANEYWRDGFTVFLQDIYVGQSLTQVVDRLNIAPLYVVVLAPRIIVASDGHSEVIQLSLKNINPISFFVSALIPLIWLYFILFGLFCRHVSPDEAGSDNHSLGSSHTYNFLGTLS